MQRNDSDRSGWLTGSLGEGVYQTGLKGLTFPGGIVHLFLGSLVLTS
jgi:hypothetical protein